MRRAVSVTRRGDWPADRAASSVTLDYDARYRRRMMLDCSGFGQVLLDLPEATVLADGDGLKTVDGNWIAVRAAPEDLLEVRLTDPIHLLRAAWHLGNHHCPADLAPGRIRIRRDPVIESMLRGLGCDPVSVRAAFNPEKGAYHAAHHGEG